MAVIYRLFKQIVGYTRCCISGVDCGRLLMICKARRIYLWEFRASGDGAYEAFVLTPYVRDLKAAAAVCGGTVKIFEAHGLPAYVKRAAAHRGFFIGLFFACGLIYGLSRFIWAIEVDGNSFYTDETISEYLKEINAGVGGLKKEIVPSKVEEKLRLKYPRMTWVSAQIVGTKLKIHMEEGQPDVTENSSSLKEIKAPYAGKVVKLMLRSGTAAVRPGDIVKKGDILVRGSVDIYSDDGAVLKTVPTDADADVVLAVTFKVERSYDRHYVQKIYDDAASKNYILHFFGRTAAIPDFLEKEMIDYDEFRSYKAFRLTKDFYLPLGVETIVRRAYTTKKSVYTERQMKALAEADLSRRLEAFEAAGAVIVKNQSKMKMTADALQLSGEILMEIPCTTSKK